MEAWGQEEDKEYNDEDLGEEEVHTLSNTTYAESEMKSSYYSLKYFPKSTCLITYIAGHVFRDQDEMLKFLICPYTNKLNNCHWLLKFE
jgi:hypothetical protein